jgi:hypothetical protein
MFSLTVVDHIMIATASAGRNSARRSACTAPPSSWKRSSARRKLDHLNLLVDIAAAKDELRKILDGFDYRNLDAEPSIRRAEHHHGIPLPHIHSLLCRRCREGGSAMAARP